MAVSTVCGNRPDHSKNSAGSRKIPADSRIHRVASRILGAVQPPATRAPLLARGCGEILVNGKKKGPETSLAEQIMVHGRVLRWMFGHTLRSTPLGDLDQAISFFEGIFLGNLSQLAQKSPQESSRTVPMLNES